MATKDILMFLFPTFVLMKTLEIACVITGIAYIILAADGRRWCWVWGGINAVFSTILLYLSKLYAESFLYLYYIIAAFYGWQTWQPKAEHSLQFSTKPIRFHLLGCVVCVALSWALGLSLQHFTDAKMPIVDAHTTVFSFWATYLTTKKLLENWLYWLVIDLVTAYLYFSRNLPLYALLMLLYASLSLVGYYRWKHKLSRNLPTTSPN